MGEWSKTIGEAGEKIVGDFFEIIGWSDPQKNQSITCAKGQLHGKNKTHGIDYLFSYSSQLEDRTLNHLIVSLKFTSKAYPASPNSKFKEHFYDLLKAIECFKHSEIRSSSSQQFSGVDNARDIGLLFWLSNDIASDGDIISKIANVRITDKYAYESIYIVDNHRISFIYDTIKYLKSKYIGSEVEFFYPNTGRNFNPKVRSSSGKTLPVEFINSSVQLLKITNTNGNKTFIISVIEEFHTDHLKRLLGLAQDLTLDLATETLIIFPNYNQLQHENDVRRAKAGFEDKSFTKTVTVSCYRNDFRSVGHE